MDNIITAQEVVTIAFPAHSNMKAESINEYVIHSSEIKYIRPALGKAMYANIGNYAELCEQLKPALAFFVKCELIPSLSLSMSNGGIAVSNPQYMTAATDKQRTLLLESELDKAQILLDEVIAYIGEHREDYPEYEGKGEVVRKAKCGIIL